MANDAKMGERKVPAPAAAGDRVAARFAMLRNPHPAVESTAAPDRRVDGGHAGELVPMREGLREQCHPIPHRTAIGRAANAYPVARLYPVGANVDRGPGGEGEGGGREREHEGGGEGEGEPAHGPSLAAQWSRVKGFAPFGISPGMRRVATPERSTVQPPDGQPHTDRCFYRTCLEANDKRAK